MSASSASRSTSKTRGENTNRNTMIKSSKSTINNSIDVDESFIIPKIKASNSNLEQKRTTNSVKKTSKYNTNSNSNEKSLHTSKSSIKEIEKRNTKNDIQRFSDSDYSDIQIRYIHNTSNRFNGVRLTNKALLRPKATVPTNRQKPLNKSSLSLKFSSSESSSDSIRVKKKENTYRNINYRRDDSESGDKRKRYNNTIDTVLESDTSDDIPFLDSAQDEPEIDFKSYMKKELDENENKTKNGKIESAIEKDSKIEKSTKNSIEFDYESDQNIHQKEKSYDYESDQTSTSSNNLNKEKERNKTKNKKNKNYRNDGIVRTKHYNSSKKYKISKKKHKSISKIKISSSESEEEKNEPEKVKENEKVHQNEHQSQNDFSHSNSETENKSNSDDLDSNQNEENNENDINNAYTQTDYEHGVTDPNEVKRLCNSFMKRRPGYKIPKDLVPYKMHTYTKMSFHGKKAKFILFRGDIPLLLAKLKNKNGSDPIVNIFTYLQSVNSKKEKKKDKSKSKEKSKNHNKIMPIAIIMTSLNFSTFSLLKSESKSEPLLNENEIDEFQAIHNSYGLGYGKEVMTIKYTAPKVDYAPRIVDVHFNDPPPPVPKELSNRKPKFTYGSTFVIDIGGRIAKRSIKNCIMVDENNNDIMSIMKIRDSEVSIEAFHTIGELSVFAFGISSVLCKM